ncbi:SigE family RNA polymerase sigma factor [Microlunatus parietis]|uniref:RNA polymerase sigma-70 factor (Sigma-E family) n=1 Tax=Microlunatus parietis TaxID=682979 RepID=A0A7Y9IAK6_9ACTN|nr:SigE family RNA polymerase sigma factor [Microlunatus parietis]NYE72829.1 RNA polymerase sigma-70 factor (sigma-E family) [Microlunatus parietis]
MVQPETSSPGTATFEEYAGGAWPALYRSAYLLTGNHADAEDVAQQTLEKAYQSWSRVVAAAVPEAYLRHMLTNTFLSGRRSKRHRLELLTDCWSGHEQPHPRPGPEDQLMLWPHLRSLPPRQRAVIVLRYFEDLSEEQIAEALGCSRGNVKSTAHRALKALRAALGAADLGRRKGEVR